MEDGDFFAMNTEEGAVDAINDLCAKARKLRDKTISTKEYFQIQTDFQKKINTFRDSVKNDIWDMLNKYCPDQKPVFSTLREQNDAINKYMKTGNLDDLFPGVKTPGTTPTPPPPPPTPTSVVPPKPTPESVATPSRPRSVPVVNIPPVEEMTPTGVESMTPSVPQPASTPRETSQSDQYNLTPQDMRQDVATGQGGCPPGQFPAYPGGPCRGSVAPGFSNLVSQAMTLGPSGASMPSGGMMPGGYSSGGAPPEYSMAARYPVVNI